MKAKFRVGDNVFVYGHANTGEVTSIPEGSIGCHTYLIRVRGPLVDLHLHIVALESQMELNDPMVALSRAQEPEDV